MSFASKALPSATVMGALMLLQSPLASQSWPYPWTISMWCFVSRWWAGRRTDGRVADAVCVEVGSEAFERCDEVDGACVDGGTLSWDVRDRDGRGGEDKKH